MREEGGGVVGGWRLQSISGKKNQREKHSSLTWSSLP